MAGLNDNLHRYSELPAIFPEFVASSGREQYLLSVRIFLISHMFASVQGVFKPCA